MGSGGFIELPPGLFGDDSRRPGESGDPAPVPPRGDGTSASPAGIDAGPGAGHGAPVNPFAPPGSPEARQVEAPAAPRFTIRTSDADLPVPAMPRLSPPERPASSPDHVRIAVSQGAQPTQPPQAPEAPQGAQGAQPAQPAPVAPWLAARTPQADPAPSAPALPQLPRLERPQHPVAQSPAAPAMAPDQFGQVPVGQPPVDGSHFGPPPAVAPVVPPVAPTAAPHIAQPAAPPAAQPAAVGSTAPAGSSLPPEPIAAAGHASAGVGTSAEPLPDWSLVLADGVTIPLYGPVVVGRNPTSERFPGATLAPVSDPTRTMSKTHARFYLDSGTPMVDDLGSTNGITLLPGGNKQGMMLVEPGAPAPMESGDVVHLGNYEIAVRRN